MTMENKRSILITGANGFIGSFIVEEALKRGFEVWAAVRKTSNLEYLKDSRIRFIQIDMSDSVLIERQLKEHKDKFGKWDYIIHNAGVTKCRHAEDFDRINYIGTKTFIDTLIKLDLIPEQFFYMSTLGVFGAIHEKDGLPIKESDIKCPNTLYGISKYKSEQYISSLKDFPYVFIRPTGVYGPREKDYYLMAKSVSKHIDFRAGCSEQFITFIYVKDLVRIIFLAIEKNVKRKAYCVSDGEVYNSTAFSVLIQKELGNPFVLRFACPLPILKAISYVAGYTARLFGKTSTLNPDKYKIMKQRNWRCDISHLREDLGYEPEYLLDKGVKETIAWYKANKWL